MIGLGVMALGCAVLWWLIPTFIDIPRRVPLRALSPAFWPKVLGWTLLVCGLALTLNLVHMAETVYALTLSARVGPARAPVAALAESLAIAPTAGKRLVSMAAILLGMFLAIPVVGMVWTSMLAFVALVVLTGSRRLGWGIVAGVALPLILYLFFTKVAGVAIPQGQIVRLP